MRPKYIDDYENEDGSIAFTIVTWDDDTVEICWRYE